MKSFIMRIRVSRQAIGERRPSKAFRDDVRIVAERGKGLAQHLWLPGTTGHAVHLSL
jgi:hypothetical protein